MSHIEQIPLYLTWKIRHKVLYPTMDFQTVILPDDDEGIHLGLFDENSLISVVSLFKRGASMQFRKFATLLEFQNKGYGSQLLIYLTEYSKNEGCNHIWCNARESAAGFYSKLGFLKTDRTYHANDLNYLIMEKQL